MRELISLKDLDVSEFPEINRGAFLNSMAGWAVAWYEVLVVRKRLRKAAHINGRARFCLLPKR